MQKQHFLLSASHLIKYKVLWGWGGRCSTRKCLWSGYRENSAASGWRGWRGGGSEEVIESTGAFKHFTFLLRLRLKTTTHGVSTPTSKLHQKLHEQKWPFLLVGSFRSTVYIYLLCHKYQHQNWLRFYSPGNRPINCKTIWLLPQGGLGLRHGLDVVEIHISRTSALALWQWWQKWGVPHWWGAKPHTKHTRIWGCCCTCSN